MTYSIVYSSKTGNTARLAEAIHGALPAEACAYFGTSAEDACTADLIFAGFWTDKGTCDTACAEALAAFGGKRLALFGTAGFGQDKVYFSGVLQRITQTLPAGCTVISGHMCQGKMPPAVREHYIGLLAQGQEPEKMRRMIENFDRALPHPDEADLRAASAWATRLW